MTMPRQPESACRPLLLAQLAMIMPVVGPRAAEFIGPLNAAMEEFGIDTCARQRCFLAQIAHESGQLKKLVESLNYTPDAILATFNTPKITRFTREQAEKYGRTAEHPANQEMIANIAYANRMGNGDVQSGDGWRYRGRGLMHTTGSDNYTACMLALDIDCVERPELLGLPENAARAAGYFWQSNGLNKWADANDFHRLTKVINGGYNGMQGRLFFYDEACKAINY